MKEDRLLLSRSIPGNRDRRRLLWPLALLAAMAAPVAVLGLLSLLRLPGPDLREELELDRSQAAVAHARSSVVDKRAEVQQLMAGHQDLDKLSEYTAETLALARWCASNRQAPLPDRCVAEDGTSITGVDAASLLDGADDALFALKAHRDLALIETDFILAHAAHTASEAALTAMAKAEGPSTVVIGIAGATGGALLFLAWMLFELGRWVPMPTRVIVRGGEVHLAGITAKLRNIERCVAQGSALVLVLHDHKRIGETRDLDLDRDTLHELAREITETVHALQAERLPAGMQPTAGAVPTGRPAVKNMLTTL